MDKIDRLGWAAGMSFVSYGVRVGIRVNRAAVLEQLVDRFPPGWKPSRAPVVERLYSLIIGGAGPRPNVRRFNILYGNVEKLLRTLDLDEFLDVFESDVKLHVAAGARRRVFVHAGAVGWKGKAILIPGRSFSGKTTLVAELVRAGATYYSDEYAVLDGEGLVHPYARPLSVRENGKHIKQTPATFGGQSGRKPLPVGLIIASRYKEGARWRPKALSAAEGALELILNTVSIQRQPEKVIETLRRAIPDATILKGVRGEAKQVVDFILAKYG
ncbi:MAG TPA: hypothetical protein VN937_11435 [Blastocatellia bacterium]|nr:hypothetical protein [Blastocatellia bacterium]